MENILTILTETDREEIKRALKDIIIEQIRTDFEERTTYIYNPSNLDVMFDEAIEEVKEQIKPLLEQELMKQMKEKLGL